ncbi:MAG: four helix bundle protein [Candidatus Poribacteria bacterium]
MRQFRNILAWQKADDLIIEIYKVTSDFPKDELYSLVSQMRRSATSVAANIAEGSSRSTSKDYLHFLNIAKSSLTELEYYLHLTNRLGYLDEINYERLDKQQDETARLIYGLIKHIEKG